MKSWLSVKVLFALFIFSLSLGLHAAEQKSFSGIYSSLGFNEDSGDLDGMELLLVPEDGSGKYTAVLQVSEGGFPQVMLLHIQVKDNKFDLVFKMGGAEESQQMKCSFEDPGISCKSDDGQTEKMKHGKSYWQGA